MSIPLSLLLAAGCVMGPSPETLIDELRVLATLAEPPEAGPGEAIALDTRIVNPTGAPYEALSWTCTRTDSGCAEALGTPWLGASLSAAPPPDDQIASSYLVPSEFSSFLGEDPIPLVQHWTLACVPGLCPPIEALRDPESADADAAQIQAWLTNPTTFLADLPLEGVSLGLRSLLLSSRDPSDRVQNPTVSCSSEVASAAVGESIVFTCQIAGELTGFAGIWGYTTAGGWEGASQVLLPEDVEVEYTYVAPEEPQDEVPLWLIVVDGEGGVGLWEGSIDILAE